MKRTRLIVTLVMIILVIGSFAAPAVTVFGSPPTQGPANTRYIVVFKDGIGADNAARELAQTHRLEVTHVYQHAIKGMAAAVPAGRLNALQNDPRVAYVEADQEVYLFEQTTPTGVQRIFADENEEIDIDGSDDFRVDVDVAVIDTGIDLDHVDLNVVASTDCTGGGPFGGNCGSGGDDDNGHGTHVAGTIGALDNGTGVVGVAPGARQWAVKVLRADGSGYISWIVAGIDWVTARADQIEVANMSLGCECESDAMDTAIANSVAAGITYAVAAGNSDKDSTTFSPANHPDVITVSALADFNGLAGGGALPTCRTDQDDTLADFSNWGSTVEIAAPGVCILSAWHDGGYNTISGTSMASPHAAGAAALRAASGDYTPSQIRQTLINEGNSDWTDDSGDGIKEPLLDVSNTTLFNPVLVAGNGGGGDTDASPTVSISSPSDGAGFSSGESINFSGSASDDEDGDLTSNLVWTSDRDGQIGTGGSFSSTTLSDGTHVITASVTDSAGNSSSDTVTITVGGSSGSAISLSVNAYKIRGNKYADLSWSGASSTNVDVYRNGSLITTTANDGAHTDGPLGKGGSSATYQVCEAGTTTCSDSVTVTW